MTDTEDNVLQDTPFHTTGRALQLSFDVFQCTLITVGETPGSLQCHLLRKHWYICI